MQSTEEKGLELNFKESISVCLLLERHKRKMLLDQCVSEVFNNEVTIEELVAFENIKNPLINLDLLEKIIKGYGYTTDKFIARCLGLKQYALNSTSSENKIS